MKNIDDLLTLKEVKAELERQNEDNRRTRFFNFLLKRMVTCREAEQWLSDKKVTQDDAEIMIDDAKKANLINDIFYAKEFIAGHDNWGKRRIIFELGRRGVSSDDISDAFSELESENNSIYESDINESDSERKKIIPLISSWLDSGYDLSDKKDLNKIKGRLYRRGFSERDIRSALDEFI